MNAATASGSLRSVGAGGLGCGAVRPSLPEDLRHVATGETGLAAAFLTLARHQDEQARGAADLLERETWALTTILAASAPIWTQHASPTFRFTPDRPSGSEPYHLELGLFSHLALLRAPSVGEQALLASRTPCWARVYPHHERLRAGQAGALAHSYVPIGVAEAVATLGLDRILTQVEGATRSAGQVLLAEARAQEERQERLLAVERMLGWEPDPTAASADRAATARARLVLALLMPGLGVQLALGSTCLVVAVALAWFLVGNAQALIWLVAVGVCLLIWRCVGTPRIAARHRDTRDDN